MNLFVFVTVAVMRVAKGNVIVIIVAVLIKFIFNILTKIFFYIKIYIVIKFIFAHIMI